MKKLLILIILISSFVQAQFYEIDFEVKPQIHFTDKALEEMKQYYPDQKQRDEVLEMSKNIPSINYQFSYNKTQSQSVNIQKIDNSQQAQGGSMGISPDIGEKPIFDYKEKVFYNETDLFVKKMIIYDSLNYVNFTDTGKSKTILGIETKEAIGKYKDVDVIAWYAPLIPQSYSPDKYYGTIGLILELHYKYTKDDVEVMISWNATKKKELKKAPIFTINNKLQKVSYSEFMRMIEEDNQKQRELHNQGVDRK